MANVHCASFDCVHNRDNICIAGTIRLADGHIHTVHQGFKHIHECKTYCQAQYYKELEREIKSHIFRKKGGVE